ncbi:PucC family protein [Acuticoccus sp.]|uniref:PucC family protein n=1 Tax=Acuticoccus sp. TaxID=1904378 RepID=UPI003B5294C7
MQPYIDTMDRAAPRSAAGAWRTIARLALVQAAIASVTVLPISTIPRLMVEELALLAVVPGVLVAIFYAAQGARLRFGYGSDVTPRRTPWILGGLALLGASGVVAALAVWLTSANPVLGLLLAGLAYAGLGLGVGAAGTTLFALLATTVSPERLAPAATGVFVTMIAGLVVTAKLAGAALEPFTFARLVTTAAVVAALALVVGAVALAGVEGQGRPSPQRPAIRFWTAVAEVWAQADVRRFALFILVSMLAYNMQELVMEPFSAAVFGLSPGQSTRLSGDHHAGVLAGLVLVGIAGRMLRGRPGVLVGLTMAGCFASAAALGLLALAAFNAPDWPLQPTVLAFGLANGVFAGAAIASMFSLAKLGASGREGTRIGLWGAAQAIGFGVGMFFGAALLDALRAFGDDPAAFAGVFLTEAALFALAALVAMRAHRSLGVPPALPA